MDQARFGARLIRWQGVFTVFGLVAWFATKGTSFALSFLVGALASGLSFWLLYRIVFATDGASKPGPAAILGVFRLLLIGGAISAILSTYELQTNAAATGILIVVVSILIEALREHLHGT